MKYKWTRELFATNDGLAVLKMKIAWIERQPKKVKKKKVKKVDES